MRFLKVSAQSLGGVLEGSGAVPVQILSSEGSVAAANAHNGVAAVSICCCSSIRGQGT